MATEKATETTATQNPAPKAPARARASRAKDPAASKGARKDPRAAAKLAAEVLDETTAALERALLENESARSLQAGGPTPARSAPKACCGQCGREMRFVPFALSNLMCRSCYGLDRYRRPAPPSLESLNSTRDTPR